MMDSKSAAGTLEMFRRANELWFWEGRTHEAAWLYEQAARAANTNPAFLLQWARAQRAMGQPDAAFATLSRARSMAVRLTPMLADHLLQIERLWASPLPRLPAGLQPDDLDVPRLATLSPPSTDWMDLAAAAEALEAYGVAFYARLRGKGPVTIIDEEKDDWALIQRAERELAMLDALLG